MTLIRESRLRMPGVLGTLCLFVALSATGHRGFAGTESAAASTSKSEVTVPLVSADVSPIEELRVNDNAYAVIRKPPGDGPFPVVVLLHGGLRHASWARLTRNAMEQPTSARFLAWGYMTVNATRRSTKHDPEDRGVIDDTLAVLEAVKHRSDVDPESIVLDGGSGGGTLALEVARKTELAAVVAGEPATIIFMSMFTKDTVDFDRDGNPTGDRRWDLMSRDPHELYTYARAPRAHTEEAC